MEQNSELVYEGKLIHESRYPHRPSKYEEVEIDGVKVDFYDAKNRVIHEIKKSNKLEKAHEWQLKYYMYVFEQHGIEGVRGILEYPEQRKTMEVFLTDVDRETMKELLCDIERIIGQEKCPPLNRKGICRNCSYFDFCYSDEMEGEK